MTKSEAMPAKNKPSDAQIAGAARNLENAVRELMHMADITANAYGDAFCRGDRDEATNSVTYKIPVHEDDQIAFLVNNVASRCYALKKQLQAAINGENAE